MKKPVFPVVAVFLFTLVTACSFSQSDMDSVPRMELDELVRLLEDEAVVIVDVRSARSYLAGHIPGAVLMPPNEVESRYSELEGAAGPVVVYCA